MFFGEGLLYLHYGATIAFGVVDVEGDKVFTLDARAMLVVDTHILPLKAELEQATLWDRNFHLSMFACHLSLNNVILICSIEFTMN